MLVASADTCKRLNLFRLIYRQANHSFRSVSTEHRWALLWPMIDIMVKVPSVSGSYSMNLQVREKISVL